MFYFNKFFKKNENKSEEKSKAKNKEQAKERLHLVLMQDRAHVSADFLDMMRQEIIDVIKKYVNVDDKEIDVKLTNKQNSDGTIGAPALYANIPFKSIKTEIKSEMNKEENAKSLNTLYISSFYIFIFNEYNYRIKQLYLVLEFSLHL